jgi:LPS export ABC transporter permease LptG/LPS export ABC transporter permease LptF
MRTRLRFVLSRALVAEMLPTLVLATIVSTFILLIRYLFIFADLFISHNVRLGTALYLLFLTVPNILALTLPIGTLFAVLMTAARWTSDSEMIAAQACGVPLRRIARPLVGAALLVFGADAALAVFLMPYANHELSTQSGRVALSAVSARIEQHVFAEEFPPQLLYVDKIDHKTGRWHGVLLFNLADASQESLVVADSGELVTDPRDGTPWLYLQDTSTHILRPDQPESYRKNDNNELKIRLAQPAPERSVRGEGGVREIGTAALIARVQSPSGRTAEEIREAKIELHKRIAIPAAAVVFAIVGFPLGLSNRRGAKGFGLTASVILVVVYYVVLVNGETLAGAGKVAEALGVWLPNLVLTLTGAVLFRRASLAGATPPGQGFFAWLLRAASKLVNQARSIIAGKGTAAREAEHPIEASLPESQARPAFTLGVIDRYLLRRCLSFLLLVVVAVIALTITIDLSGNLEDIRRFSVPFVTVASYYLFQLPQMFHDLLPLAFLIAFLGTATALDRNNETTAFKAAGISLSRISLPLLLLGFGLGAMLFLLDDNITQKAERSKQRLEDIIRGRSVARSYRATDRPFVFLPDGRTLVSFLEFDADTNTLVRPSVYMFDARFNLRTRYMAQRATYRDGHWLAEAAWSRAFVAEGAPSFTRYMGPVDLPLPVAPDYFGREFRKPTQMSFRELEAYIHVLRAAGYRVDRLVVQLHQKLAYPLAIGVLAWLSLSFAFRPGRRSTVGGVAFALVLGMAYFAVLVFLTRLGEAALLPPALASWSPTGLFALLALNRHTHLRT